MQLPETLQALEAAGSAQTRKTYARHGVPGAQYGVNYSVMRALAKKIKTDHALADQLWATGNHDARILATMVADPAALTARQVDRWSKDASYRVLTQAFAGLVALSAHARSRADKWTRSEDEFVGCAGWSLIAHLAGQENDLPDSYFLELLAIIEREVHSRKNYVRYAMMMALIAIGVRNEQLQAKVLAAAARIGKVEVDHGDTSCKTPDAAEYIHKTVAYRQGKRKGKVRAGC